MRICIVGAGAIGGYMGAKLAQAGADVSLVARGPHLAAMREHGLTLIEDGERSTLPVTASEDPAELGPQDYVIVTLKAHSVPPMVTRMQPLLGPETTVVMAVNGVPWWYFHGLEGPYENLRLETVDPGGVQWDGIGPERVLGCVVYPAAEVPEPGGDPPHRGQPLLAGRAVGGEDPARPGAVGSAGQGRAARPGAPEDPRRAVGQALGQTCRSTRSAR